MLSIRKGIKDDLPSVFTLVKELATYEKAPNEVTNTIQMMEKDGFGENPIFEFYVAEDIGKIVGIALYYFSYSTWKGKCIHLEDIIVTEHLRGKGIGKRLFEQVIKVAKNTNAQRLTWQVLDWNTPAIEFYKKYNPTLDSEWIDCKFTAQQLKSIHF